MESHRAPHSITTIGLDRLYSPSDAAEIAGVHRSVIYRALDAGALRAQRAYPGAQRRIPGSALVAWIHGIETDTEENDE